MRFRAEWKDVSAILSVLQCFEHLGKLCLVELSPDRIRIMMTPPETQGEQAYAELFTEHMFDSIRVESKQQNHIPFLVSVQSLAKVIRSGDRSEHAQVRLTKKNDRAYLSFDILSNDQRLLHDVPIQIVTMSKVAEMEEPALNEPAVKLKMPDMRMVAQMASKIQHVSESVQIDVTSQGRLTFSVGQPHVSIKCRFDGLKLEPPPSQQQRQRGMMTMPPPASAQEAVQRAVAQGQGIDMDANQPLHQHQQQQRQQLDAMPMDIDGQAAAASSTNSQLMGDGGMSGVGGVGLGLPITSSAMGSAMDDPAPPSTSTPSSPSDTSIRQQQQQQQQLQQSDDESKGLEVKCSASINMKKFVNVTHAKNINAAHVIACIVEESAFIVYMRLRQKRGNVTFYLPLLQD